MGFTTAHRELAKTTHDFTVGFFEREPYLEDAREALNETGKWDGGKGNCPLNPLLTLSFVVMMTLKREVSIANLLKHLLDLIREESQDVSLGAVKSEAMCHARKRLGPEPLKLMYEKTAERIDPEPSFLGFRTWGVDGVHLTMPDTPANEAEFGRPGVSRGNAAFPQMNAVLLVDAATRLVKDAVFGRCNDPERPATVKLIDDLGDQDLVFMDRGISAVWVFKACSSTHFLGRISASWKPTKICRLGDGDSLVMITGREVVRTWTDKNGKVRRKYRKITMTARMIEYTIKGGEEIRLITDLLDPEKYPARELAVGYHIRWESELSYDELKTHFATVTHGTLHTTFRSKKPAGVLQEAYAMLIGYNMVRELIAEAGKEHDIPPLEISFLETVHIIRLAIPRFQRHSPDQYARLSHQLLEDVAGVRNKRPRRKRQYDRVVKVKMSKFGVKGPQHKQMLRDFEADLVVQDASSRMHQ